MVVFFLHRGGGGGAVCVFLFVCFGYLLHFVTFVVKQCFAHCALAARYAVLEWLSVKTLLLCQIDASLVVMKGCACLVLVIVLHRIFFDGGCHQCHVFVVVVAGIPKVC